MIQRLKIATYNHNYAIRLLFPEFIAGIVEFITDEALVVYEVEIQRSFFQHCVYNSHIED